jgi:hypothetical protein
MTGVALSRFKTDAPLSGRNFSFVVFVASCAKIDSHEATKITKKAKPKLETSPWRLGVLGVSHIPTCTAAYCPEDVATGAGAGAVASVPGRDARPPIRLTSPPI